MQIEISSIMNREIDMFSRRLGLSSRETEVFQKVVTGLVSAEGIGQSLGISPNTVTNHIKSILDKTGTNSKSELIVKFLNQVVVHSAAERIFVKKPKILVVDDEKELCDIVTEGLTNRGCKVRAVTNPLEVMDRIHQELFDFIISDIRMPQLDGFELLVKVREMFPHFPMIFFMTGHSQYSDQLCYDKGAAGFFEKPFDMDSIFHQIMSHYIDSPFEGSRFFRTDIENGIVNIGAEQFQIGDVGFGGLFIHVTDLDFWKKSKLSKGQHIAVSFKLTENEDPISAVCEVMWTNDSRKNSDKVGMGVQFKKIDKNGKEAVQEYVRLRKIKSFIPIIEERKSTKS